MGFSSKKIRGNLNTEYSAVHKWQDMLWTVVTLNLFLAGEDEGVCVQVFDYWRGSPGRQHPRSHRFRPNLCTWGCNHPTWGSRDNSIDCTWRQDFVRKIHPHEDAHAWAKASLSVSSLQVDAETATAMTVPEALMNPNVSSTRFGTAGTTPLALTTGVVAMFLFGWP